MPVEPLNIDKVHGKDAREADHWWLDKYRAYHDCWDARANQVVRYQATSNNRPSVEYMRWHSDVARKFLFSELVFRNPWWVEMPADVLDHVAPVPAVPLQLTL